MGGFVILDIDRVEVAGLDDIMVLDEPTMRPRALPSGILCSACPNLSGSNQS